MGYEELDKLKKYELFKEIKDKCKSRALTELFWDVLAAIIIVALVFWGRALDSLKSDGISVFIISIVFGCIMVWAVLNHYRFYTKIKKLETPEQLLLCYEKKNRSLKFFFLVTSLIILGEKSVTAARNITIDYEFVLLGFVVVAMAYLYFVTSKDDRLSRKDQEIVEQLRELVEKG